MESIMLKDGNLIRKKTFYYNKKEFFVILFYKLLLDFSYVFFESKIFSYAGFSYEFVLTRYLIGWGVFFLLYLFIRNKEDNILSILNYSIFLLSILPYVVMYQFALDCPLWSVLLQSLGLIIISIICKCVHFDKGIKVSQIKYDNKMFVNFIYFCLFIFFGLTILKYGLPNISHILEFGSADIRQEVELSTFSDIIQTFICKIICPLCIAISLMEKKYFRLIFLLILQIYVYMITGFKTYLFIPIVLIGINFLKRLNLKYVVIYGLIIALLASIIYNYIFNSNYLYALIGDRVIFFPARIKYAYFDYFSNHSYVYFSQSSIFKFFRIESNYTTYVPYLIGDLYFDKPNMWTNTGFMADAFANLGVFGVVIICCFTALAFVFIHSYIQKYDRNTSKMLTGIFILFFISLNDGSFITIFFSGGLLFAILSITFVDYNSNRMSFAL